jgi:hypothetical protein
VIRHRRSLELVRQILDLSPDDAWAKSFIIPAHFRIGHDLRKQGLTRKALDQYYTPSAKDLLNRELDPGLSSAEVHGICIAQVLVGDSHLELDQPAEALPHLELALRAEKVLIDRESNNARHARDWSGTQSRVGTALIASGRFDEGTKFLQEGVRVAEGLAGRDPMNGSFQSELIEILHRQAKGFAKIARSPEISPARQAELWRQAIQVLTRCEDRLASAELDRVKPQLSKEAKEISWD